MRRRYEITVFGATGFTGGLTARYLARHAPPDLRWAIAGRSREKLEALRAGLIAIDPRAAGVGVVVASVNDPPSLQRMAADTHVVLTTVGPFIHYGEPVVRACVEQGADYVDSTGEVNFVALLLARYHSAALSRGVRLVASCGLDTIPADLGALFTVKQLPSDQPIALNGYLRMKGTFSGGTERSAILSLMPPPGGLSLAPPSATDGRRVRVEPGRPEHRPELGGWTAPLPTLDRSTVVRSAAADRRYGPDFSYGHHYVHGPLLVMLAAGLFFGMLAIAARIAPLRALLLKLVKKPGTGPSEAQMDAAWFKLRFVARAGGQTLETEVSGGDPGYRETSKMLAEAALCLVRDHDQLPAAAGVLTPAQAMGDALIPRLQRAGMQFRRL